MLVQQTILEDWLSQLFTVAGCPGEEARLIAIQSLAGRGCLWASKPWNCSSTPVHGLYQAAESATSLRLYNVDVFRFFASL